jgi:hypothetical protein
MKTAVEQMRKDKMAERMQQKQQIRQRMIDAQFARLQDMEAHKEQRLDRQVAELEKKQQDAEEASAAKRAARRAAVERSRQLQVEMRDRARREQMEEEEEYRRQWTEQNAQMAQEEKAEAALTLQRNKELQAFLRKQVVRIRPALACGWLMFALQHDSRKQARQQSEAAMMGMAAAAATDAEEEERFQVRTSGCGLGELGESHPRVQAYAREIIAEFAAEGKPIQPILRTLKKKT